MHPPRLKPLQLATLAKHMAYLTPPPDENTFYHRRWRALRTDDEDLPAYARRFVERLRLETQDTRWCLRRAPRGTWLVGFREKRPATGFRLWREVKQLDAAIIVWANLHHYKRVHEFAERLDAEQAQRDRDAARAQYEAVLEMADVAWRDLRRGRPQCLPSEEGRPQGVAPTSEIAHV